MWVIDGESMVHRSISFVPELSKIIDGVLLSINNCFRRDEVISDRVPLWARLGRSLSSAPSTTSAPTREEPTLTTSSTNGSFCFYSLILHFHFNLNFVFSFFPLSPQPHKIGHLTAGGTSEEEQVSSGETCADQEQHHHFCQLPHREPHI